MNVAWTQRALSDLERIGEYIARHDPQAADRWLARLLARALAIPEMPLAGRVVPEVDRSEIREVFVKTYRIAYRLRDDEVLILTIVEGHRLFPSDAVPTANDDG